MIFREGRDMSFEMIDSELMELYEAALRSRGLLRNTTSFYMRILRTVYKILPVFATSYFSIVCE